jgi:hypothetical protein
MVLWGKGHARVGAPFIWRISETHDYFQLGSLDFNILTCRVRDRLPRAELGDDERHRLGHDRKAIVLDVSGEPGSSLSPLTG